MVKLHVHISILHVRLIENKFAYRGKNMPPYIFKKFTIGRLMKKKNKKQIVYILGHNGNWGDDFFLAYGQVADDIHNHL